MLTAFISFVSLPGNLKATNDSFHPRLLGVPDENDGTIPSLNIRLSTRPVRPPDQLIKKRLDLSDIKVAPSKIPPSPQAAILEDDQGERFVILSIKEPGVLTAYLLRNIPLEQELPRLKACTNSRQCGADRQPLTGGMGCVAMCLREVLEPSKQP